MTFDDDGAIIDEPQTQTGAMQLHALNSPSFRADVALKQADERIAFIRKAQHVSLGITSIEDWSNQDGKPYLESTGCEKIRNLWGVWWKNLACRDVRPEGSAYPCYEVTGLAGSTVIGGEPIEIVGGRDGADPFFCGSADRPKRVDPMDVRKAAYSNFEVQAVTRVLGLRGLTWDEVEAGTSSRITRDNVSGQVRFKQKPQDAEAGETANTDVISESQAKRLYAIAKKAGYSDDEIKRIVKLKCGVEHSREIPRSTYEEVCKTFEMGAK